MCKQLTESGDECAFKKQLQEVQATTANLDQRLTQVEHDVGKMRSESQDGFRAINASIANLAHDFGNRMNSMDARLVEEKVKWGEVLRWVVKAAAIVILSGCAVAMGVSIYKQIFAGGVP